MRSIAACEATSFFFMERPEPGVIHAPLEALGFRIHEIVGMILLPTIRGWFIWLMLRRREPMPRDLFGWLTSERHKVMQAIRVALSEARQGRLARIAMNRIRSLFDKVISRME